MKKDFFDAIDEVLSKNDKVFLLCAGLGYPRLQELIDKYPYRVFNAEASEQTALDMAVGLCYAGFKPVVYTITPFFLRGFETIRTYIDHERLPVIMIGAGRDDDYAKHDGFSHDATDDKIWMGMFKNIVSRWPTNTEEMKSELHIAIDGNDATYINLKR